MIIFWYLTKLYLRNLFMVIAFIAAILLIVDGIDQYTRVQSYGVGFGLSMLYVVLRIPDNLYQFMPLVILIAALMFFLSLARNSELVALRASGMPASRIVLIPIFVTFLLGVALIGPLNSVLVKSRILAEDFIDSFKGQPNQTVRTVNNGIWVRDVWEDEVRFIYVAKVHWKAQTFKEIELFIKKDNTSTQHIIAKSGTIEDGYWVLKQTSVYESKESVQTFPIIKIQTKQEFASLFAILSEPKLVKNRDQSSFIKKLDEDGYDIRPAKTYFYSELAFPLFLSLMCLVGSVFALAPMRGGGTSKRALFALTSGFGIYGVTKLTESMAKAGDLPVTIGVLAIPIAGFFIATSLLLHQEDG